jgi:hypothetical protein
VKFSKLLPRIFILIGFFLLPVVTNADSKSSTFTTRELSRKNTEIISLIERLGTASTRERGQFDSSIEHILKEKLEERGELVSTIITIDPGAVVDNALPEAIYSRLPEESRELIETPRQIRGKAKVIIVDHFDDNFSYEELAIEEEGTGILYGLNIAETDSLNELNLSTGDIIEVSGLELDYQVAARMRQFSVIERREDLRQAETATASSIQNRKVLVLLINFAEGDGSPAFEPFSVEEMRHRIFTGDTSVRSYIEKASYGQWSLTGKLHPDGDFYGWITLNIPQVSCEQFNSMTFNRHARIAAAANGIDSSDYDHYISYYVPNKTLDGCNLPGGHATVTGKTIMIYHKDDKSKLRHTLIHEFGHNFGFLHSSLGNNEYGDPTCFMGNIYGSPTDFHGFWRHRHWLPDNHFVLTMPPSGEGLRSFPLQAIDNDLETSGVRAITIPCRKPGPSGKCKDNFSYYITAKAPFTAIYFDASIGQNRNLTIEHPVVLFHIVPDSYPTGSSDLGNLNKMTQVVTLLHEEGQLFHDPDNDFTVKFIRTGGDNENQVAYIDVYPGPPEQDSPSTHTLSVSKTGSGRVESGPAGINCGSNCSADFNQGQAVVLSAIPDSGYIVSSWGGGCAGNTGNLCTVNMSSNKSVSVTFESPPTRTLTVRKVGPGSGAVTSNPSGINCGSTCSKDFLYNHMVTLVAHAASGSVFGEWVGPCSSITTNDLGFSFCSVHMTAARQVDARFNNQPANLSITSISQGTSEESVRLEWDLTGVNSKSYRFNVYRGSVLLASNIGSKSYIDTAGLPGTTYTYRVEAYLPANQSQNVSVSRDGWRKLSPPTPALIYPQGQAGEGIFVSFNESCGATHHRLYRTTSSDFHPAFAVPLSSWTPVVTLPKSCPRGNVIYLTRQNGEPGVDYTAEPGKQYYYWVEAMGQNRGIVRSAGIPAKRLLTPPKNLSASIHNKFVSINFHTSNGATHYCLYRGRTNNFNAATRLTPCPEITCPLGQICSRNIIDNNPPTGTNYYWITAATSSGRQNESAPSNPIQVTYIGDSTNNRTSSPNTIDLKLVVLSSETNAPISGATVKFKQNGEIIATAQTREDGYTPCTTVPVNVLTSIDITRSSYASAFDISIGSSIPNGSDCVSKGAYKLTPISEYTLAVSKSGLGRIESGPAGINCGSTCSASFNQGQAVVLSAFPASGMIVDKWEGACASTTGSLCTVNMTSNKSASVTFKPIPTRTLTISKSGTGEGLITSNPSGINCGSTCSNNFLYNHMVTLIAHTPPGSVFAGWSGACSGTATTCSVQMNVGRQVTATFNSVNTVQLRLRVVASGTNAPLAGASVTFKQNGVTRALSATNEDGYTSCVYVPINQPTRVDITRTGYNPRLNVGIGNSSPSSSGSACVNKGQYSLTPN